MKKLLIGLGIVVGVLVVAAVAAVFILPAVLPLEDYKDELAAEVEKATGRNLTIDGDVSLSILPTLELEADNVSLSNAKGARTPNMLELSKLQVQLAVWPLLRREVVVDRFVLVDPVINLEIDRNGRPNWDLSRKSDQPASPSEPAEGTSESGDGPGIGALRLGDVRLVNGRLSFTNRKTGESQLVQNVNMKLVLPDLDSLLEAEGALTWNGEKIELDVDLDTPSKVLEGQAAKLVAKVESDPVALSYDGTLTGGKTMTAAGKVDLAVPSVRDLAEWAGQPLQVSGTGFGPLSVNGDLRMAGPRMSFTNALIRFDEINGRGELQVNTGGVRPAIEAKLDIDKLDLNPYMPPPDQTSRPAAPGAGSGGAEQAEPQGWSDEPLDLSGLKTADADLALTVGAIEVQKLKIGRTALDVVLNEGLLDANLKEMALYEGKGTARIKVDGAASVPTVQKTLDISGVEALPFLTDAMGLDRIEGTANATLDVTTRGRSQKEMVSALAGDGKITFVDGAIRGVNLAAMVRNVSTAFLDAEAGKAQKTDFAELGGTYTIEQGILTNKDLVLKSPLLRLNGAGTVNLPRKRVDYRITPKVVATIEGQGSADRKGLAVPVLVKGPWNQLSFQPDVAGAVTGALKDPEGARRAIQELGKGGGDLKEQLKQIKPEDAIKGLFGGDR